MSTNNATSADLLLAMLVEQKKVARDAGRLEAITEAAKVLLRCIDRARDKRSRAELELARALVLRLGTERLDSLEGGHDDEVTS